MRQGQVVGDTSPERCFGRRIILDVPVLVIDPVVLGNVEPHQSERAVLAHPGEQAR